MPRKYDPPLLKVLFGRATTCAYPGCDEDLIFEDRGHLTVNVDIAHIRSASEKGPRYDPHYPESLLDTEENLLLLCGKHHRPVDDHESVYPTAELLQWKREQVARKSSKAPLSESQLATINEAFAITLDAEAVSVIDFESNRIQVPLGDLDAISTSRPILERYIGVMVTNTGLAPATVARAGIDLDFDLREHAIYLFPQFERPRLDSKSSETWMVLSASLQAGIVEMATKKKFGNLVPIRFRPFAEPASGDRVEGEWMSAVHLPIWKPGMTEAKLTEIAEKAAILRRGRTC